MKITFYPVREREEDDLQIQLKAETASDVVQLILLSKIIKAPVGIVGYLELKDAPYLWINIPIRGRKFSDLDLNRRGKP